MKKSARKGRKPRKPRQCKQCKETFSRPHNLTLHLLTAHTTELQKVVCPFCSELCSNITNLRVHSKRFHKNRKIRARKVRWTSVQRSQTVNGRFVVPSDSDSDSDGEDGDAGDAGDPGDAGDVLHNGIDGISDEIDPPMLNDMNTASADNDNISDEIYPLIFIDMNTAVAAVAVNDIVETQETPDPLEPLEVDDLDDLDLAIPELIPMIRLRRLSNSVLSKYVSVVTNNDKEASD